MPTKDLVMRLTGRNDSTNILCEITGTVELADGARAERDTLVRIGAIRDIIGLIPAEERTPGGKLHQTATLGYLQEVLINVGYKTFSETGYGVSFSLQP